MPVLPTGARLKVAKRGVWKLASASFGSEEFCEDVIGVKGTTLCVACGDVGDLEQGQRWAAKDGEG